MMLSAMLAFRIRLEDGSMFRMVACLMGTGICPRMCCHRHHRTDQEQRGQSLTMEIQDHPQCTKMENGMEDEQNPKLRPLTRSSIRMSRECSLLEDNAEQPRNKRLLILRRLPLRLTKMEHLTFRRNQALQDSQKDSSNNEDNLLEEKGKDQLAISRALRMLHGETQC